VQKPEEFKERFAASTKAQLWLISWSGRGRMPLREIHGENYVEVWAHDVRLPQSIESIQNPDSNYDFNRVASIQDMVGFIKRVDRMESDYPLD
jgi:hypothetical protein